MELFKLVGSIFVDNEEANKSLAKTDEKAKKTGASFGDIAKGAAKVGTAVVAASSAAVTGIVALANNAASAADEIDKGSIRMGISTDYFQELGYAAEQSGVSMQDLEKAAKKLEGTDLNMEDAMKEIMSLGTAEERAAKAAELFGESAAYTMKPLIEQSGESFDELTSRAHDLGLVMGEDTVKAGVKLGDTMSDIKKSFSMVATNLGGAVLPLVQNFSDMILGFMPVINQAMETLGPLLQNVFSSLMPPLMDLVQTLLPVILDILNELIPIVVDIMSAILPVIVEILGQLLPPIMELVQGLLPLISQFLDAALPVLTDIIMAILPILVEIINAVFPFIQKLAEKILPILANVITELGPLLVNILGLIQEIFTILGPILDLVFALLEPIIDLIGDILPGLIKVINFVVNLIKTVVEPIIKVIRGAIEGLGIIVNYFGNVFKSVWTNIKSFFAGIGDWLKEKLGQIGGFFSNLWEGIKNGAKAGLNGLIWFVNKVIVGLNAMLAPLRAVIVAMGRVFGANWDFNTISIPQIPQLAKGGESTAEGGLAQVGEKGPEIVDLPKGATVIPLNRSSVSLGIEALTAKVDQVIALIPAIAQAIKGMGVYIDGSELVGAISEDMDEELGRIATKKARYA